MLFPEDNPAITTLDRLNIEKFCTFYYDAKKMIDKREFEKARSSYVELLRLYDVMQKASFAQVHLNVAHHCVKEVYTDLNDKMDSSPLTASSFRVMMIVTVLVLLAGVTVVLTPSLSGLAVLDSVPVYSGPAEFYISGLTVLDLNDYFTSSGPITYLVTESDLLDVTVDRSKVYIMPRGPGKASMMLIASASNPPLVTKVPVVVNVG